jgi:fructokinase
MKSSKEPSVALDSNPEHALPATPKARIGIDLGGTKIEVICLEHSGLVSYQKRFDTPRDGYESILKALADAIYLADPETDPGLMKPIGIGMPGAVSKKTGLMKNCNTTELNHRNLAADLGEVLNRPVKIANDADCFTLSEAIDGAGQDYHCVFGVILGTGVGGGIAIHQTLLAGPNAIAGEWGHNRIPLERLQSDIDFPWALDRPCYCGQRDCIETWLSGAGVAKSYEALTGERWTAAQIFENPDQSEATQKTFQQYSQLCALSLSTVINLIDPEIIVLGGGLSKTPGLCAAIAGHWAHYVFSDQVDTRIESAQHGDASGVRGAAWLWSPSAYSTFR